MKNEKNLLVSVLIPCYNSEKTLTDCLSSLRVQSYKNYEVIIVNNNSKDQTERIIKKFALENKKFRYIFEPKKGRGIARNAGIKLASGEIIAMTDSDCIVPQNWLEEITKPIREGKEEAVMGFEEDPIKNYWTINIQRGSIDYLNMHRIGNYVTCLDTKNFAIKTFLMKKFGFNKNINNLEDYDLALRLRGKVKVLFLPDVKVKHFHKTTLSKWAKLEFNRAYWVAKTYKKHDGKVNCKNDIMMQEISWKNNFLFPFIALRTLIKKGKGRKIFLIISDVFWKIGLLWAFIRG